MADSANPHQEYLLAVFLEVLATPWAEVGATAFGDGHYMKGVVFFVIAAIPAIAGFIVLGVRWPRSTTRFGLWISERFGPVVEDVRWWLVIWFVALGFLSVPTLAQRIQIAQVLGPNVIPVKAAFIPLELAIIGIIVTTTLMVVLLGLFLASRRRLPLQLRVWSLDPRIADNDPRNIVYKAKLTLILRNESGQSIEVQSTSWSNGVGTQAPFRFAYSPELTPGECDWSREESIRPHIEPGCNVKLWIGLDKAIAHSQLDKLRERVRLGTLSIIATVGDQLQRFEYQV